MKHLRFVTLFFLLAASSAGAQQEGLHAQITPLVSKALSDYPGKEVVVIEVEYPPGAEDPVHRHNAHAFVYVLEGSIVMAIEGGQTVTLTAGETFYEGPDDIHTVGHNASLTEPARFLAFLLKNKDEPILTPLP
jgi:quercetin dioxygenase-like cupin family protein